MRLTLTRLAIALAAAIVVSTVATTLAQRGGAGGAFPFSRLERAPSRSSRRGASAADRA